MKYEGQISPEDFANAPTPQNALLYSQNPIADLEKEDGRPTVQDRAQINTAAQGISIIDKIDDKIAKDLQDSQTKFKNIQGTPKDILKSIIARGEYREDFNLFGVQWTMRALDQGDILMAIEEVKDTVTTTWGKLTALEFVKTSFAIEALNGVSVYEIFDEVKLADYQNKMSYILVVKKALQRYLEAFPPSFIDALYDQYTSIDKKRSEALEELKKS